MCIASPIINIPHQSGTVVTIDGPILTYHDHPMSNSLHSESLLVLYNLWIWTNVCTCMYVCVCVYGGFPGSSVGKEWCVCVYIYIFLPAMQETRV